MPDAAPTAEAALTLPAVAVRLGRTPDWLRRRVGADPELGRLFRSAGRTRFVEPADLPAVAARVTESA